MDRFENFQTFVAVVEAGQFSAAAERLGVANSVVSRRISELEAHLGAQLLQRTTRRLSLTASGRDFYKRAIRLLAELEEAEQSVSNDQAALSGRLRLATPLSFGLLHLTPILNNFMKQHPELQLEIELDDRQIDLVEEGIDIALRIGELDNSSLVARPLAPIRMLLCASPAYVAKYGNPQTPQELAKHRCLVYGNIPESHLWHFIDSDGRETTQRVSAQLVANNGDMLLAAAIDGLGVTIQPTFLAYRAIVEGSLIQVMPNFRLPTLTAYVVYPSRHFVPRRVRELINFLVEQIGERPYWDRSLFD